VSAPYYEDEWVTLYHGDCRDVLPTLAGVACVVTSPPYNTLGSRHNDRGGMHAGSRWTAKVVESGYSDDMTEADYVAWQKSFAAALAGACDPGASSFYYH